MDRTSDDCESHRASRTTCHQEEGAPVLAFHDHHGNEIEEEVNVDDDDVDHDDEYEHADDGEIAGVNEDMNDLPYDNDDNNNENEQDQANENDAIAVDGNEDNEPAGV